LNKQRIIIMENKKSNSDEKRYTALDSVYAAISMALFECDENNTHDAEAGVLTMDVAKQHCQPWGSKILTLRHAPKR
jgi:hypothetical protein